MIYRGISVTGPKEGKPVHIQRLRQETPWAELRYLYPATYNEACRLISLYDMALGVLHIGVVAYYQEVFTCESDIFNPHRLIPCEEWHCPSFEQLCRFSKANAGFTKENKSLRNACHAFLEMEGDPLKGHVKGALAFERSLHKVSIYFFQVCEQKAEYLCKALDRDLRKSRCNLKS